MDNVPAGSGVRAFLPVRYPVGKAAIAQREPELAGSRVTSIGCRGLPWQLAMWQKSGRQVDRSGAAAPDHPGESGDGPMTTAPHATAPYAAAPNATIGRRKLRTALRRAREEAGYTQEQVARAMEWSLSKLI